MQRKWFRVSYDVSFSCVNVYIPAPDRDTAIKRAEELEAGDVFDAIAVHNEGHDDVDFDAVDEVPEPRGFSVDYWKREDGLK